MPSHYNQPSLANFLAQQVGLQQRAIPQASQQFLDSNRNPNTYNQSPGNRQQFVHPMLQALYNAPGNAASSLAGAIGGVRAPIDTNNLLTQTNLGLADQIALQTQ